MVLRLCAVGDIMLGQQPLSESFGVKDVVRRRGPDFLFDGVRDTLDGADVVLGNLECSVQAMPGSATCPDFFCAEPAAAEGMARAGIDVLSVANNHAMDHGLPAFLETADVLRRNRIAPVGIAGEPARIEREGQRISLLSCSFVRDGVAVPGYARVSSVRPIVDDIGAVRDGSDLVIVALHWGARYVPFPCPKQVRAGRALVDAGADIVLGWHPHVTQGYEHYRDGLIVYSLGNFIFDHTYIPAARESSIAEILVRGTAPSIEVAFHPIVIDERTYQPRPADPDSGEAMREAMEATRATIEGQDLAAYEARVGDYDAYCRSYLAQATGHMRTQFLRNFHRYSVRTSVGVVRRAIGHGAGGAR